MSKKITITLSEKAEKFFNELMYSLDENSRPATQSQCINWALEAHMDFEECTGEDVISHLQNAYKMYTPETPPKK